MALKFILNNQLERRAAQNMPQVEMLKYILSQNE
jgi:hypothetical protein